MNVDFAALMRRVRAGDEEAAAELVRHYEPVIRRVVRIRLVDARLRRVFDSQDICQSVLGSFFVRAALGQFEVDTPEDLLKLLTQMARNKLSDQARRQAVRGVGGEDTGVAATVPDMNAVPSPDPSPSKQVALRELLHEARRRLSEEERRLLDLREQGREWAEIAAEMGVGAEALRKRFSRAVNLVAQELGLDEANDE
jgi:RNA polymerase sigma-70 factor (ECF subfamily)